MTVSDPLARFWGSVVTLSPLGGVDSRHTLPLLRVIGRCHYPCVSCCVVCGPDGYAGGGLQVWTVCPPLCTAGWAQRELCLV